MHARLLTGALVAVTGLLAASLALLPSAMPTVAMAQGTCADPGKALGVARTIEIDTATGPLFGGVQYADHNILKDGEVVLTFDDGPLRPYTRPVLDALDAYCTKATFFMVGRMAIADPAMVQMVARRGHTIGAHTWSHQKLGSLPTVKAKEEIELGFSAIQQALGQPIAPFFRFPYLSAPKGAVAHVQSRQSGIFSIDIDSEDFRTRDSQVMIRTVLSQLASRRKGILLFHDIQPATAAGLRTLLGELKSRGFKVVHLVPKVPLVTLAEYDARITGEARRRAQVIARNPLAQRSLAWSMWEAKVAPGPATAAPTAGVTTSASATPGPIPAAPPATPAARPPRGEPEDWRAGIFGSH
jgi:peptidoglycan/xylan/chitin deacetylase (PgdA/CDA1 family)